MAQAAVAVRVGSGEKPLVQGQRWPRWRRRTWWQRWASAGGALYNAGGIVTISASRFGANRVIAGKSGAGGLAGQGADGGLDSGDGGLGGPGGRGGISGAAQGGAIFNADGTLLVERSTFSDNAAQGGAGGAGNDAGRGGGGGASYFAPGADIEEITRILIFSMAGISVSGGPGGTGGDGGQGGNADGGAIHAATGSSYHGAQHLEWQCGKRRHRWLGRPRRS